MLEFAGVTDLNDFYRSPLPETLKIKNLITNIRLLYQLPPGQVLLQVAEGERVYKIVMKDAKKKVIGWFLYYPLTKTLELYDNELGGEIPIISWKNKKVSAENYYKTLILAGCAKMFVRITSLL